MAPVGPQTETVLSASADTTLFAGANRSTAHGARNVLTVSTSATANHDSTAIPLIAFAGVPQPAWAVLTAVLELRVVTPPTVAQMLLTVIGVNGDPIWTEGAQAARILTFPGPPVAPDGSYPLSHMCLSGTNILTFLRRLHPCRPTLVDPPPPLLNPTTPLLLSPQATSPGSPRRS